MAIIIFPVHGTGEASPSDHWGRHWWQIGSPFLSDFLGRIDADLITTRIHPYHWSGANNQDERQKASAGFINFVNGYASESDKIIIIAFSHGANVVADALDYSPRYNKTTTLSSIFSDVNKFKNDFVSQRSASNSLSVVFVGAPFFVTRKDFIQSEFAKTAIELKRYGLRALNVRSIAQAFPRLSRIVKQEPVYWALASILLVSFVAHKIPNDHPIDQTSRIYLAIFVLMTIRMWTYVIQVWSRNQSRQNLGFDLIYRNQVGCSFRGVSAELEKISTSVYDQDDEAANGLKSALGVKFDSSPTFSVNSLNIGRIEATFLLLIAISLALVYHLYTIPLIICVISTLFGGSVSDIFIELTRAVGLLNPNSETILHQLQQASANANSMMVSSFPNWLERDLVSTMLYYILLTSSFLFILMTGLIYKSVFRVFVFDFFLKFINLLFSAAINAPVSWQLKNSALGFHNSKNVLYIAQSTGTYFIDGGNRLAFRKSWEALPEYVHASLRQSADMAAQKSISELRESLGRISFGVTSTEALRSATQKLTWRELIHTSYFYNEDVQKLIAYSALLPIDREKAQKLSKEHRLEGAEKLRNSINNLARA